MSLTLLFSGISKETYSLIPNIIIVFINVKFDINFISLQGNIAIVKDNYKEYRIAFGENLRKLRKARNLDPIDLAALIGGVDPKQIYRIENAENIPSHEMIIAIAVKLGYTPAQLHDFKFPLKLNTEFRKVDHVSSKSNLTYLRRLMDESDFLKDNRTVSEIVSKCSELFKIDLKSTSVSIALKSLVIKNELVRTPSSKRKNRYLYRIKN
uniref:helix-turn-helix domain-containing protein n=1 Tax=Algoriphagus locisalis TaxID=305507 RepID=UPI00147E992E|nr:helix-turn-helix transcriptional regulator [Algoriphagus locisalis]